MTQSRTALNHITEVIIGAAIKVHRELGPGLLESAYCPSCAATFVSEADQLQSRFVDQFQRHVAEEWSRESYQ